MVVCGLDPGTSGAVALYNPKTQSLCVWDLPNVQIRVNRKNRTRLDSEALLDLFQLLKILGCELLVIEQVGGRPNQSASSGFVFGHSVGLCEMAAIACGIPFMSISPQKWKGALNVTGKRGALLTTGDDPKNVEIVRVANNLMPGHQKLFVGPKGGLKVDKAEAALIAYFGAKFLYKYTEKTP